MVLILLLTACSTKEDVNQTFLADSPSGVYLVSTAPSTPPEGDFGVLATSATITKVFTIKSRGRTGTVISSLTGSDSTDFQLLTSSCNLSPVATCTVRVRFSSAGKLNGNYSASLNVDDLLVPLSADVSFPQVDPILASDIKFSESGVDVNSLNFGTVTNNSIQKVVIIKDLNKKVGSAVSISLPEGYSSTTTSCPASSLNSSAGCSVRIIFSGSGKTSGEYAGSLVVLGKSLSLQATVQSTPVVVGTPEIKSFEGSAEVSSVILGGSGISSTTAVSTTIKFTNTGTGTAYGTAPSLSSSDFYLSGNGCGGSLLAGRECLLKVNFTSSGKAIKNYTSQLSYLGKVVEISANVLFDNCGAGKYSSNGVCQALPVCSSSQHLNMTTKECDPNLVACLADNAQVANRIWSNQSQSYGSCVISQCQPNYNLSGNQCQAVALQNHNFTATFLEPGTRGTFMLFDNASFFEMCGGDCGPFANQISSSAGSTTYTFRIDQGKSLVLKEAGQPDKVFSGPDGYGAHFHSFTLSNNPKNLQIEYTGTASSSISTELISPDHEAGFIESQITTPEGSCSFNAYGKFNESYSDYLKDRTCYYLGPELETPILIRTIRISKVRVTVNGVASEHDITEVDNSFSIPYTFIRGSSSSIKIEVLSYMNP